MMNRNILAYSSSFLFTKCMKKGILCMTAMFKWKQLRKHLLKFLSINNRICQTEINLIGCDKRRKW